MRRATTLTIAAVMSVALSVAGQTASAAGPSPATAIPADFVTLTDDAGTLTVGVPASWTEVSTGLDVDFGIPSIKAAPDAGAFLSSFDAPGMTLRALPYTTDTDALARRWGWDGFCEHVVVEPYDDGVLVGTDLVYTGCIDAEPQTEAHVVAVNVPGQPFTALLHAQLPGPDQRRIIDGILATVDLTADVAGPGTDPAGPANSPDSTAPKQTATTATAGIGAAFAPPSGNVPTDWTPLVDLSGTLTISVPSTWTDVTIAEFDPPHPLIQASPDQYRYSVFAAPGVVYRAYYEDRPALERLKTSVWLDDCTRGPVQTYDDGLFAGYIAAFDDCDGTNARVLQLEANPRTGEFLAEVVIFLPDDGDYAALVDGLLSSFNISAASG